MHHKLSPLNSPNIVYPRNLICFRCILIIVTYRTVRKGVCLFVCLLVARQPPQWARDSSFTRFLDHTQRPTIVGRTPLDEWSARRRDLYLTTHNTHNRQTDIHAPPGVRTHNTSKRAAADLRLRPRGHWDRHKGDDDDNDNDDNNNNNNNNNGTLIWFSNPNYNVSGRLKCNVLFRTGREGPEED